MNTSWRKNIFKVNNNILQVTKGDLIMSGFVGKLDVFIEGENIDLCIPTREFAQKSSWYSWLNDPQLTRYLNYGAFPNTPEDQLEFFDNERKNRLLLVVSNKTQYVGVISLSKINWASGEAGSMAMIIDKKLAGRMTPWISLEAIARITMHAMEAMGLNRINSGQHMDLVGWQNRKEVLGYRLEGIFQDGFVKGRETAAIMRSSILFEDYLRLKEIRGGEYWDGLDQMKRRIKNLPKETLLKKMEAFYDDSEAYYNEIFKL